ncbi:MAG: TlyA family RNA methyltransferase [Spartobacteria bacterium]|nr:TlyA family RNA methyltransferase [Spartobacteria bacterium]
MKQIRLDQLIVQLGLTESREKAQRLIRAGEVLVDGHPATKPGHTYPADCAVVVKEQERFVSRGGLKLEGAFDAFNPEVTDCVCMDIGASTGGFTDCLLQHGARRVYAIDVGKGQLHWKLRTDDRVVVMEGVNARYLTSDMIPDQPAVATFDTAFISLTKLLLPVTEILAPHGHIIALIKPQFEAGKELVEKGGVVRDPAVHEQVIERIRAYGEEQAGLTWLGVCPSPLKGPAGNIEFLSYWEKKS